MTTTATDRKARLQGVSLLPQAVRATLSKLAEGFDAADWLEHGRLPAGTAPPGPGPGEAWKFETGQVLGGIGRDSNGERDAVLIGDGRRWTQEDWHIIESDAANTAIAQMHWRSGWIRFVDGAESQSGPEEALILLAAAGYADRRYAIHARRENAETGIDTIATSLRHNTARTDGPQLANDIDDWPKVPISDEAASVVSRLGRLAVAELLQGGSSRAANVELPRLASEPVVPPQVRGDERAVRTVRAPDPGYAGNLYTLCRCGSWVGTGWWRHHTCNDGTAPR